MKNIEINTKSIDSETMKKIQLNILNNIDSFCRQNGIKYFLYAGTLIGAIRHKGYIPWDDDIDIAMLRSDYDRFVRNFTPSDNYIELAAPEVTEKTCYPFAKVYDSRTRVIDTSFELDLGVNIDIFPLEDVPNEGLGRRWLFLRYEFYRAVLKFKYKINRERFSKAKKLAVVIIRAMCKPFPHKWLMKKVCGLRTSFKGDSDYVSAMTGVYGLREIVKKDCFTDAIEVDFEGQKYLAPVGYDDCLRTIYGDYMTPPPVEKQAVGNHSYIAYWK